MPERVPRWKPGTVVPCPLALYVCRVEEAWIDYNNHMTESAYLLAFGWASDALFRYIGIDEAYRAAGRSFYTVETHINYYREAGAGEPLHFTTLVLGVDEKRLHFFHTMTHGQTGVLLCTTEQMLLHVDMQGSRAASITPAVHTALVAIAAAHAAAPRPKEVGRQMALPRKG